MAELPRLPELRMQQVFVPYFPGQSEEGSIELLKQ